MITLESTDLWTTIARLTEHAEVRRAAVAYVSDDHVLRFRRNDLLVTDASKDAISSGQTSAAVIKRAVDAGALVYSYPGLHAKLVVLDDTTVVGSQNLSAASQSTLLEAGIVTDDPIIHSEAIQLLDQLRRSGTRIYKKDAERLLQIPVIREEFGGRARKQTLLEALRLNSELLKDFVFCMWTEVPILSDAEVRRQATKQGLELPESSRWDRFEDVQKDAQHDALASYEKFYVKLDKKTISVEVEDDAQSQRITRFVSIGSDVLVYVNHFVYKKRVIGNFKKDSGAPFLLGGAQAKTLLPLLNRGLAADPALGRTLWRKRGWVLQADDIRAVLDAAEAS